ncbi:PD-(D/E)XK motif protein [Streptomyces sp. NPDC051211]|uniref:PD-(D/E)XK motif protein n=1 Tax=Streptomyces sp. NPDC051211 TaxID=3154643 RepID=UPI00344C7300
MSGTDLRLALDRHWAELAAAPVHPGAALRVSELHVPTDHGPVSAAMDADGLRHLLIPLKGRRGIPTGRIGGALRISERRLQDDEVYGRFADLVCTRRDLDDVFTGLCGDVLVALEAYGRRPYRTTLAVVNRWRQLFSGGPRGLTVTEEVGLAGELLVLIRLLNDDPGAVRHWTGPEGARHDFSDGVRAVEVKSTLAAPGRRTFEAHGLDQLEPAQDGQLLLAWYRFERRPDGRTVGELVAEAAQICDDESELSARLARLGYPVQPTDGGGESRLIPVESRWYEVDDEFPRLTCSSLAGTVPDGVYDVRYTVDLAGVRSDPLDDRAVATLISNMGGFS